MKTFVPVILIFSTCIIAAASCKNKNTNNNITTGGGVGGGATICVIPEHHGYLLDSCTVYIKYGTLDAPANGVYDDSQKCTLQGAPADTTPTACFPGLQNGVYYLFAAGYHPGYGPVKGGGNWTVSTQDSQFSYPIQKAANYLQTAYYN